MQSKAFMKLVNLYALDISIDYEDFTGCLVRLAFLILTTDSFDFGANFPSCHWNWGSPDSQNFHVVIPNFWRSRGKSVKTEKGLTRITIIIIQRLPEQYFLPTKLPQRCHDYIFLLRVRNRIPRKILWDECALLRQIEMRYAYRNTLRNTTCTCIPSWRSAISVIFIVLYKCS